MALIEGDDFSNALIGTSAADSIEGWGGPDLLIGLGGDDFLNGGPGADIMIGGTGNDVYIVDNVFDYVFESANAGIDMVLSSISFSLNTFARANIENLHLIGIGNLAGVGNALENHIEGNDANNSMEGLGGNDTLEGVEGNDSLFGGNGADMLLGGSGNDLHNGGLGADVMGGGQGSDRFRFSTALGTIDTIQDFTPAGRDFSDRIELDDDVFTGVGPVGMLAAAAFHVGNVAQTPDHRIIYNSVTGALFFDPDGTGLARPIQFATLAGSPADVSHIDFAVIA